MSVLKIKKEDGTWESIGGGGSAAGDSTVEIDSTLTQSGKAADAKTVGDKISLLTSEINEISENIENMEVSAESDLFLVEMTFTSTSTSTDSLGAYMSGTANHSQAEINAAITDGKYVYAKITVGSTVYGYASYAKDSSTLGSIFARQYDVDTFAVGYVDSSKNVKLYMYDDVPSIDTITATVGQIAKVKSIDSNGNPTAWEAVDMPSFTSEIPTYTTSDAGKVLSITADGLSWVSADSLLESAEGGSY